VKEDKGMEEIKKSVESSLEIFHFVLKGLGRHLMFKYSDSLSSLSDPNEKAFCSAAEGTHNNPPGSKWTSPIHTAKNTAVQCCPYSNIHVR